MSRFPALKTISLVFKLLAVAAVVAGVFLAVAGDDVLMRIPSVAGGLLSGLLLWAFSELISVVLAIESNTWMAPNALTRSSTVAWTPASSRSPQPSPADDMTTTV